MKSLIGPIALLVAILLALVFGGCVGSPRPAANATPQDTIILPAEFKGFIERLPGTDIEVYYRNGLCIFVYPGYGMAVSPALSGGC